MENKNRNEEAEKESMQIRFFFGRVLWFNRKTRCGCIVRADGNGDCYIDGNTIFESFQFLKEGEEVQFEIDGRTHKAIHLKVMKRQNLGCCS